MPAPTMQTSHSASSASGGKSGTSAVAIHADTVEPESVFGAPMGAHECNSGAGKPSHFGLSKRPLHAAGWTVRLIARYCLLLTRTAYYTPARSARQSSPAVFPK